MTNDKTSYIVWFAYQTFVAHREIFEIYFLISKKIHELILHLVQRAVLPTGRIFGRITQKGPVKNMCGRAN